MAATQRSRSDLALIFRDGETPAGEDFESIFLSSLNAKDDGVQLNGNGDLELTKGGVRVNAIPGSEAGTIRLAGTSLQYHNGSGYQTLSTGSSGAFVPIGSSANVAFQLGNVGIGAFAPTVIPNRLEVVLGPNTGVNDRVKFGNLVIHKGAGTAANPDGAYVCHSSLAGNNNGYALFQDNSGNTTVNTALISNQLILSQAGEARIRLNNAGGIELTPRAGNDVSIGSGFVPKNLLVSGNLTVNGVISNPGSDLRVKKDVQPFQEGFQKILGLNPVKFKYNGKAGTPDDGRERIGFVAQDLQKVYPELVISQTKKLNPEDQEETEVLNYDSGALTYVIVNAIKEIAIRLDNLEKKGTDEKRKTRNKARTNS